MSTAYRKPSIRPAVSSRRIGVIRAHPLWAYFLITYLVTWSYWLVIYGLIGKAGEMWAMPGVFVPALAAVVITGVLGGRSGLRVFLQSWIRWRVSPRWYVFTLVVLPALVLLTYIFLPDGAKGLERGALGPGLTYLATFIVILFVGGGQEEPGWRGFALPRLQEQFGPVPASLALGALWGIWHLPLFILVPNYDNAGYRPGQIATTFIIFAGGFMVGLSLLLTWLFNQTNGSVLLAMLAMLR
jgi:uncharacterized protein